MTASSDQPEVRVAPSAEAAANDAAALIAQTLTSTIAEHVYATLGLSGGSAPVPMLQTLAALPVDWSGVSVFQVDERIVEDHDPERNWAMIGRSFLAMAAIPQSRLHPMPVCADDVDAAAVEYASLLRSQAARGLDVVQLGLGPDGHTASWPPGDPVVDSAYDVAVIGEFNGCRRMTLTPRVVNTAAQIVWLVTGTGKRDMLRRMLAGEPSLPASRVRRAPRVVVVTDPESAP